MGSVSGTGIVLISELKVMREVSELLYGPMLFLQCSNNHICSLGRPWLDICACSSAGPNPSSSRYDGGSGRIFLLIQLAG